MSNPDVAPRPPYRFAHDTVPPALASLADKPQWVAWDYEWKGNKWTKPPLDPHTGRKASVSNPATWGTFDEALAAMQRYGLTGVGFVLTDDDELTGIDLDNVVNDAGFLAPIAAKAIEYAETYAETSPSGEGIRVFALGKVANASKDDGIGVEIYGKLRYLTVTGDHIADTPCEIRPAPRTIALVQQALAKKPNGRASPVARTARPQGNEAERLADALPYIPSDDRKVWLDVGMGIKSAFGESGLDLWRTWSASSEKYDDKDLDYVWKSIKSQVEGGITIATVFDYAKQHGWRRKPAVDPKVVALGNVAALMRNQQAPDGKSDDQPSPTAPKPPRTTVNEEPWPEPIDGTTLINDLIKIYTSHVVLPDHGAITVSLWTVYSHCFDAFVISPILAVESPEKRCGKTTLLELLELLARRGYMTSNTSTPVVFRVADEQAPTLIFDEADTYITAEKMELIGIINAGWRRRSAWVDRCEGDGSKMKVRRFRAWCPKAVGLIGNIGDIRDTLGDRSIRLSMQRKRTDQYTTELREDRIEPFIKLQRQSARWAADNMDALRAVDPSVPKGLNDRARQNWRPLLAIAALTGCLADAEKAAEAISGPKGDDEDSGGVLLLRHCKEIFEKHSLSFLSPTDLVHHLCADTEWPWATWRRGSDPITPRGVHKMLKSFGIKSQKSGYRIYPLEAFAKAWSHYL